MSTGYLSKKTKLIYLRRGGAYIWRLIDLFGTVIDSGSSATQSTAQAAARPARKNYEKEVSALIEARKAKIISSFKENEWPPDWQKRVREFKKLNALKKSRAEQKQKPNEP